MTVGKVKNNLNAVAFPKQYEINDQPSMTVPDQTMTLKEILDRYAKGLPVNGNNAVPLYDEEDTLPDMRTLDLSERAELAEQFAEELHEIKSKDEKRKKQQEENDKKELEEYRKQKRASADKGDKAQPPLNDEVVTP